MSQNKYYYIWKYIETKGTRPTLDALEFIPSVGTLGLINLGDAYIDKKPRFKKSEMRGDLPFKKGTVVSASTKRRGGALYEVEPCRKVNTQIKRRT